MRDAPGQEFYHYRQWEDWHAGMYQPGVSPARIGEAASILSTPPLFYAYAERVIREWPTATAHNLTNLYANHQPWIGRAACCLHAGATINDTSAAWTQLAPSTQATANTVADHICHHWRSVNMKGQTRWIL